MPLTDTQLKTDIDTNLPSNNTRQITASILRTVLKNVVDWVKGVTDTATAAANNVAQANATVDVLPVRGVTGFLNSYLKQFNLPALGKIGIGIEQGSVKYFGGFGATTTDGPADWNHLANARSGNGYTLLLGSATNGPGGDGYFHSFCMEYTANDGSNNITQTAVPYNTPDGAWFYRTRMNGTWSSWYKLTNGFEITFEPAGTNVAYILRRGYKFTWAIVHNNNVTINAQPGTTVNANTDAIFNLTGTAGKTLTIMIYPIS